MKHIKAGFGLSISLLFLGLLLFSACTNIFAPPGQPEGSGQSGVTIRIAGEPHIRTLYPTAEFTKYVLEFSHSTSTHANVELTGGETSVVLNGLADGTWTITAKGYVTIDIDDEPDEGPKAFEAARGTGNITVNGGTAAAPVTIALDAEMGSASGYISWDINIPNDAGIQEAYAEIIQLPSYTSLGGPMDLLSTPANRQGIQELSSGYYLVRLWVFNGYQRIGRTEVVAVYSNMETAANYTFTGADFVPTLKMSGTVTLTNTTGVQNINIIGQGNSGSYLYSKSVMVSGDREYPWEIYTAAGSASSQIRFEFEIEVVYTDSSGSIVIDTGKSITLGSSDVPNINLGTVNAGTVTIGGTIHFTGITQTPDYINIYSNSLNNGMGYTVSLGPVTDGEADGIWSMKVPANSAGAEADLALDIQAGGNYFHRNLGTITIPSTDDPNITFSPVDLAAVTWSGTIALTVNGVFPSGSVSIHAYASDNSGGPSIGSGQVNPDGTWSITVTNPYPGSKQIVFELSMSDGWGNLDEKTLTGTAQSGIDLGTYSYITLSGSVAVTMNGTSITSGNDYYISVRARPNADYSGSELGYADVDNSGNWTMLIASSPSPRNFYFEVYVYGQTSSVEKGTGVSRPVSSSQISNINLGTVAFNTITLSGHIDFKINNVTPPYMYLEAYNSSSQVGMNYYLGGGSIDSSGNWTITMNAPDSPVTARFEVWVQGGRNYDTGQTRSVYQTDIPGIELGPVYKTIITLSGTVSGTVDLSAPDGCMIAARIAGENKVLGYADDVDQFGSWSMEVEAQNSSKTVSFIAAPIVDDSVIFTHLPPAYNKTIYNTDVSGINLTGLTITTKPVQVSITSNGATPAPGVVYICNSQIVPADLSGNGNDTMWLKVIAMPVDAMYPDSASTWPSTWSLKVPGDTGNMYFIVMTDTGYYASTTPVSGSTVNLNLSTMTNLLN